MRVSQQSNLSFHLSHPNICLLSPLPNHEHRRKKKFNLWSCLPDSRMILRKTSKIPQIILGTTSLWNRCVFMRPSMDFPAIHLQWIGQRRQDVHPKQFGLAQSPLNALLYEIHFNINENYILPKSCTLVLLRFTKEDKGPHSNPTSPAEQSERSIHNFWFPKSIKVNKDILESLSSLISNDFHDEYFWLSTNEIWVL